MESNHTNQDMSVPQCQVTGVEAACISQQLSQSKPTGATPASLTILGQLLADPETKYDGMTKSTYRVVFLKDKYGRHFAAKIFPSGPYQAKAEADFRHEATRNKMALENDNLNQEYLVLALESGRGEKPFKLPSGDTVYEYNYLLTPRHSKGSLLALLMRSNHNNGNGSWYKLSIKLQRYLRDKCVQQYSTCIPRTNWLTVTSNRITS